MRKASIIGMLIQMMRKKRFRTQCHRLALGLIFLSPVISDMPTILVSLLTANVPIVTIASVVLAIRYL